MERTPSPSPQKIFPDFVNVSSRDITYSRSNSQEKKNIPKLEDILDNPNLSNVSQVSSSSSGNQPPPNILPGGASHRITFFVLLILGVVGFVAYRKYRAYLDSRVTGTGTTVFYPGPLLKKYHVTGKVKTRVVPKKPNAS